jgi:farnesyl diphosphate synthase
MTTSCWDDFATFKSLVRKRVEEFLANSLSANPPTQLALTPPLLRVREAAWYAVQGGHRWRAMVVIAAGRIFHEEALEMCLPVGASIELAHAASLVLDDLPSMDDGKLRRGQPCTHLQFVDTPWAVDMAPVFMVNLAYQLALENERAGYRERVESASQMSHTSRAMIAGQELDVTQANNRGLEGDDGMLTCYLAKSGALYGSAAEVGAITCGASSDDRPRLYEAGLFLGLAYQFMDDVCDVVATGDQSGKDSRADSCKETAVDFFGVDGARTRAKMYQDESLDRLSVYGAAADTLRELTRNASWAPS